MSRACPERDALRAFLDGRLEGPDCVALEGHLPRCADCLAAARAVPAGAWRGGGESDFIPAEDWPAVANLMRRAVSVYAEGGRPAGATQELLDDLRGRFAAPGQPGQLGRIGPYRLLSLLGAGGMGLVVQAEDERLRRPVAVKLIRPDLIGRPGVRDRFLREARAMAAVVHDHVVPVYEVGESDGLPYFVMPLLRGESLSAWVAANAPAPVATAVKWAAQIAAGLAAAHARGLVHRDIKPANLWLERGEPGAPVRVRILDFGLVRSEGERATATLPGTLMGTPEYLAPEQARGEVAGPRADLFSLGCVLYELLTGTSPFRRRDLLSTLAALGADEPADVRRLNPAVPPALARLVKQLLAKRPGDRPASADEVVRRLSDAGTGVPRRPARRILAAAGVVLAALLLSAAAAVLWRWSGKPDDRAPQAAEPRPATPGRLAGHDGPVTALLFLPGGELLSGAEDRTLRRWSLDTWREAGGPTELPGGFVGMTLSPDASTLAIADARTIRLSASRDGKPLGELSETVPVRGLTFGADGDTLYVAADRDVVRWQIAARRRTVFRNGQGAVTWLGFAPTGDWIVVGTVWGESLYFHSLRAAQTVQMVRAHNQAVRSGAFSPDGKFLATAAPPDDRVRVWSVADIKALKAEDQQVHAGGAVAVAWSVNGLVASAGADGLIRLWERDGKARGAREVARDRDGAAVTCLAFSRDGRRLAAGCRDGSIQVWEVTPVEPPGR